VTRPVFRVKRLAVHPTAITDLAPPSQLRDMMLLQMQPSGDGVIGTSAHRNPRCSLHCSDVVHPL